MSAVLPHLEITPQRPDWLAGVPGFEPGNGGIKIHHLPSLQWSFRKIREIRPVPIDRLDADSECAAAAAQTLRCSLANRRFRRSHIVVYSIVSVSARSAAGSGRAANGASRFPNLHF